MTNIQEHKAKRVLRNDTKLSLKDYKWDVPNDLANWAQMDIHRFDTFVSIGRWKNNSIKTRTKYVLIARRGELIYLEPEIIKILYHSLKEK